MTILSVASNASGLAYPSEPWILIRWYHTSIHSKIAARASSSLCAVASSREPIFVRLFNSN